MRTLSAFVLITLSLFAQANTWSGKLLDADCKADDHTRACAVLPTTKAFGLQTADGKYVKLDNAGNESVLVAIRKVRHKKGDILRAGVIEASVTGTWSGDTLKVDSVQLY
ncbi:MAG TPA: hypothetical protein VGL72_20315 [Bryobacteraceae bacterium]